MSGLADELLADLEDLDDAGEDEEPEPGPSDTFNKRKRDPADSGDDNDMADDGPDDDEEGGLVLEVRVHTTCTSC